VDVREEEESGGVPKWVGVPETDSEMGKRGKKRHKVLKSQGGERLESGNKRAIDLHKVGRGSRSYTIRTNWYVGRKGPTYWEERVVPTCL